MSEGGPRLSDPVEPMLSSEDESEADSSASVQIDSKPSSSSKAASSSYVPLSARTSGARTGRPPSRQPSTWRCRRRRRRTPA